MSKKTETIEIRVSPELKQALARLSSDRGASMSAFVRSLVDQEVQGTRRNPDGDMHMFTLSKSRLAKVGLAALPVLALSGLYAFSSNTPVAASPQFRVAFAELDRNGDAAITRDEYLAHLNAEMADEDPFIVPAACKGTYIEEDAAMTPEDRASEDIGIVDADGNGTVSYDELAALLTRERAEEFLEVDENANGFVTLAELSLAFLDPQEAQADEVAYDDEDGLSAACVAALEALERAEWEDDEGETEDDLRLWMAEIDADRDGQVSLMEYLEH